MKIARAMVAFGIVAIGVGFVCAQSLVIQSFNDSGKLRFNEMPNAASYRVEGRAHLESGSWYTNWPQLVGILPTGTGTVTVTVPVSDSNMFFRVVATLTVPPTILTTSLPTGQVGIAYSQTFAAGNGVPPYSWTNTVGSLPAGLVLSSGGVLSGTPIEPTNATFTIRATGNDGASTSQVFSLVILPSQDAPEILTGSLPPGTVGVAYSLSLSASGGTLPYTWTNLTGTLPTGLSLSAGGLLNGTPSTATNTTVTIQVKGNNGRTSSRTYAFAVFTTNEMAFIPAGTFDMGDAKGDGYAFEVPVHSVSVNAFHMDVRLVTWAQWREVRDWGLAHGYTDLADVGAGKADDHPVQSVSWVDCVKWCNARSEKELRTPVYYLDTAKTQVYRTGLAGVYLSADKILGSANGYRLPTEAEWEYAARGGLAGQRFPWGDTIAQDQANYRSSGFPEYDVNPATGYHPAFNDGIEPYTSPVNTFAANGYGLRDMAGNLWQWCWDWFGEYSADAQVNPLGSDAGSYRVYRGGSWDYDADAARVAYRGYFWPDYWLERTGFRTVSAPVR
jgi:formylglycine-generating enzyme required for sulfatase activity